PEPLVSVGSRPATTIAPQALAFMNNAQVRSWAKTFGQTLVPAVDKSLGDAITQGYLAAVARQPDADELRTSQAFIEAQIASYAKANKPNAKELALADFAQVLMSLNEFVFVD
ncbi:MAG TPA: DUF1553 domain-containing protein, partial [Pirellulaceae bacterium]|nr:DUF1553 domain-containing protein [Pirellulaceae bacterium]